MLKTKSVRHSTETHHNVWKGPVHSPLAQLRNCSLHCSFVSHQVLGKIQEAMFLKEFLEKLKCMLKPISSQMICLYFILLIAPFFFLCQRVRWLRHR